MDKDLEEQWTELGARDQELYEERMSQLQRRNKIRLWLARGFLLLLFVVLVLLLVSIAGGIG
jgi:hypothetical protein